MLNDLETHFTFCTVDSRGKEVSQAPKAAATAAAGLDYTDIPHSQIRKVQLHHSHLQGLCITVYVVLDLKFCKTYT